jgi:hypothetical protein
MLQSITSLLPLVSLTCSAIQLEMEFVSETLELLRDGQLISNEAYLETGSIQGGMNVIANLLENNVQDEEIAIQYQILSQKTQRLHNNFPQLNELIESHRK